MINQLTHDLTRTHAPYWRDFACLTLLFGLLYFFQLGDSPLANPDEARYGEIAREMVASGDYVLPRLNGVLYFEKPPLLYWMEAGFLKAFGAAENALRAGPALFALAGLLLTYTTARHIYGRLAGLTAALVLGTSLLYFALARILLIDMAVSVLMSATLFCFILGVREPPGGRRRWLFYGMYASAALATLTKGLIGFLVTGAVMFLWLLICNQWRRLRPFYLPSGAGLFLAIAAPWHILAAQHNDLWANFYFVHEHWARFTTTVHGRYQPWWYFIPIVFGGLFPWMGFIWPALQTNLTGGWVRRQVNWEAWFFAIWAAFILLFFSLSQSKLIPYILPILLPLAILVGQWLAGIIKEDARPRLRVGLGIFATVATALALAIGYVVLNRGSARNTAQIDVLRGDGLCIALALLIGASLVLWSWRKKTALTTLMIMGGTALVMYLALAHSQDKISRPGTVDLAARFTAQAKPGDRIYHYREYFHDFSFYAQREVGVVGNAGEIELALDPEARASGRFINEIEFRQQWQGPGRIWAVARKRDTTELFADSSFHYYLLERNNSHYLFSNQP